MKLTLYNFKCYKDKHVVHIDDTDITLISGDSGKGKTTILDALHFVITGISPNKVITYECNSCYVELEFYNKDTKVIVNRSKRPNKLDLKKIDLKKPTNNQEHFLQEQEAQNYLDRHFGKYFSITSYIQQHYQKTFLFQSPSEKLEILEKLCFIGETDKFLPEILKQKTTETIKKINTEISLTKGKQTTLQKICNKPIRPTKPIQPILPQPSSYRELENRLPLIEEKIKNIHSLKITRKNITDTTTQIRDLLETNQQLQICSTPLKILEQQLFIKKQIKSLEKQLSSLPLPFEKYSKQECTEMFDEYKLEIEFKKEYDTLQKKINNREDNLDKLNKLNGEKEKINQLSEGIYNCPTCGDLLSLSNNTLCSTSVTTKNHIISTQEKETILNSLRDKIENMSKIVNVQEEYKNRLDELYIKLQTNNDEFLGNPLETLLEEYENLNKYYTENCRYETQRTQIENQITTLKYQLNTDLTEEQIEEQLKNIKKHDSTMNTIEHLQTSLKRQHSIEDSLINKIGTDTEDTLTKEKIFINQQLTELKNLQYENELFLLKKKEYDEFQEQLEQLTLCETKLSNLENDLYLTTELKQIILKTESEIIQQKTRAISDLVNLYTKDMFTEPITINLHTTKRTSTNNEKVQIQLEVFYKNMKCDATILSGGEQARLNLAFILAFASVFHSPLLLLDECTSNLDQNLTECVLEQLSKTYIPKIIIIAHQVVEGNFKQILSINN